MMPIDSKAWNALGLVYFSTPAVVVEFAFPWTGSGYRIAALCLQLIVKAIHVCFALMAVIGGSHILYSLMAGCSGFPC